MLKRSYSQVEFTNPTLIRLESENYFTYLNNLLLKQEYIDNPEPAVEAINRVFLFDVAQIYFPNPDTGQRTYLFNSKQTQWIPDEEYMISYYFCYRAVPPPDSQYKFDNHYYVNFIGGIQVEPSELETLLNTYFHVSISEPGFTLKLVSDSILL